MKNTKKRHFVLFGLILLVMLSSIACSNQTTDTSNGKENQTNVITTEELKSKLNDDSWVVVDARINDAYNGWALDGVKRGGHIAGAVDFSANWLKVEAEDKEEVLEEALKTKGISKDKNVVVYDANAKDAQEVMNYLSNQGYENIYQYDVKEWAADEHLPMTKFENYHLVVPAFVPSEIL